VSWGRLGVFGLPVAVGARWRWRTLSSGGSGWGAVVMASGRAACAAGLRGALLGVRGVVGKAGRVRWCSSGGLVSVCVLGVVVFGVWVSPALASRERVFERSFGCEKGVVGCTKPDPYPLAAKPWSVAVGDASGDVYVADGINDRVQEFNSKGEFVLMFGKEVNLTAVLAAGSEAEQDVCTAVSLDACQPGTASSAAGGFDSSPAQVMFVAVDNSSGPSSGDVYVADFVEHGAGNRVSKFTSAGQLISSWGEAGDLDGAGVKSPPAALPGPFGAIDGVAVDASGDLWVATGAAAFEFGEEGAFKKDWAIPASVHPLPYGIAVDAHENVYFVEGRRVVEVTGAGVEVGRLTELGEEAHPIETNGVTVDPAGENLWVLDEPDEVAARVQLQRYEVGCSRLLEGSGCTAAETFTNQHLTGEFAAAHGVGVGPGEDVPLYVASREPGEVRVFPVATVPGVVTGKPSGLTGTTAMLQGSVNPSGELLEEGETGCRFEWGLAGEPYEHAVACPETATEIGAGTSEVAVHVEIKGLHAGTSYHYRLVAANANDKEEPVEGGDVAFGPPVLVSESSLEVTAGTAKVQAEVDPQNVDTRVRVEYGTSTGYGQHTEEVDIGAGGSVQGVPVEVLGLEPGTEYHYRFVAENVLGEGAGAVVGGDRVFRTQGSGAFRLPDGREWELVSPRDRHGASIEPLGSSYDAGGEIQASSGGGAISYVTNIPVEAGIDGFPEFAQVLSVRGSAGWFSRDLSVPHNGTVQTGVAFDPGREYRYFSEDLSRAAVQPAGLFEPCQSLGGEPQPCVSPEASEQTALVQDLSSGVFTPLVAGCPSLLQEEEGHPCPQAVAEHANVPAGTVFGQISPLSEGASGCPPFVYCGPFFEAATPDLSHIVVDSPVRLTEEADAPGGEGLYEWAAEGKLEFVGAGRIGAFGEDNFTDGRHGISNDGQRVFWTASTSNKHLFMRDMGSGEALQLDVPEAECVAKGKCVGGSVGPEFQFASSSGERVFFTDTQPLTLGSGASSASRDLYECEIEEVAGRPVCRLSDLTPAGAGGEAAGVQGVVVGASEDGSFVYFVADGVLGDGAGRGAVQGDCEGIQVNAPTPGERCNLYVWHDGVTSLVAVLSGVDDPDWGAGYLNSPTARVSPGGEWLAFMSERSLTGYDNRDAVSGEPDEEVFLYNGVSGRLVCASCDPTGARPFGEKYSNEGGGGLENGLVGSFKVWYPGTWLAANVPTWTPESYDNAVYQSRYLSDSGRLFFNTDDGLVPKDGNGQEDVYEYEPAGVGGEGARCGPGAGGGSEVFEPEREFDVEGVMGVGGGGCVALISSGTSGEESAFMDASVSGGDVFFLTAAHLVSGSIEGGVSLYDAHECTTVSPCSRESEVPPECDTAEGCRVAPEPQPSIFGAPSSATFHASPSSAAPGAPGASSTGSTGVSGKTAVQVRAEKLAKALKACRRDRSRAKRVVCERTARKRYGPAKKASKAGRAGKARRSSWAMGVSGRGVVR
jgi:DNA-binding beta-propeller fold protein YncE